MSRSRHAERGRRSGGFTLLEIVVALALLSTAFLMLLSLQNQSVDLALYADQMNTAVQLAQEALVTQEMIAEGWTHVDDQRDRLRDAYPAFHVEVNTQDANLPFGLNLAEKIEELDVTVGWKDGAHEETLRLMTYRYVPPPQP